jgi:hypothetical protein
VTLPIAYRRSTAAERRANRAAFAALKARCQANPSPEIQKLSVKKRRDDHSAKAKKKLRAALAGKAIRPFSALQLGTLKPEELMQLRANSSGRYQQLTERQRQRLRDNLYLALVTLSDESYRALADFGSEPAA